MLEPPSRDIPIPAEFSVKQNQAKLLLKMKPWDGVNRPKIGNKVRVLPLFKTIFFIVAGGNVKKIILNNVLPAIAFGIVILLLMPLIGASQTADTIAKTDLVEYVVEDIQGSNVQVLEEGETQWETVVEGQVVDSGDEIKVGEGSEATLVLKNETSVHLSEKSDMKVEKIVSNETGGFLSRLKVLAGLLLADVKKIFRTVIPLSRLNPTGLFVGFGELPLR